MSNQQKPPRKQIQIAIMSDLHCRLSSDSNDSFLLVGSLRKPEERHPVQSLISLIRQESLSAEALLIPGDLTNKARMEGLSQAWDFVLEVGNKLEARHIIPTLGNHDIESRKTAENKERPPMYLAQNIRAGFPLENEVACQQFFADGCCVIDLGRDSQLVLINSAIDHTDEASAMRGAFNSSRIAKLKSIMDANLRAPIRLAMMHHHPILHSGIFLSDDDVIPTGDALVAALKQSECRLIIHGHKHMARLQCVNDVTVFAAGSFSAILNEMGTSMGNMFHLLTLENQESAQFPVRGRIKTWTFQFGMGWVKSNLRYKGFPHMAGFGRTTTIDQMAAKLVSLSKRTGHGSIFNESEVLKAAPDLQYTTPDDYATVNTYLKTQNLKLADYDEGQITLGKFALESGS